MSFQRMKTQEEMFSNNSPLQNKTCKSIFVTFRETFYIDTFTSALYQDMMIQKITGGCPCLLYLNLSYTLITNQSLRAIFR